MSLVLTCWRTHLLTLCLTLQAIGAILVCIEAFGRAMWTFKHLDCVGSVCLGYLAQTCLVDRSLTLATGTLLTVPRPAWTS